MKRYVPSFHQTNPPADPLKETADWLGRKVEEMQAPPRKPEPLASFAITAALRQIEDAIALLRATKDLKALWELSMDIDATAQKFTDLSEAAMDAHAALEDEQEGGES